MQIKKFEFNHFPVNTYLISDETGEAAVIDCGCYFPEEEELFKNYLTDHNLSLKLVLNTHLHLDHAFGNAFLEEQYGLSPITNEAEVTQLPNLAMQSQPFGIKLRRDGSEVTQFINDGETVRFGNTTLKAILIPGHSPGGLAFYCEDAKVVFVGDILFKGSIGRTDLWGGNYDLLISGIKSKLLALPDDTVVYSGHGPETTIGYEKRTNTFLR